MRTICRHILQNFSIQPINCLVTLIIDLTVHATYVFIDESQRSPSNRRFDAKLFTWAWKSQEYEFLQYEIQFVWKENWNRNRNWMSRDFLKVAQSETIFIVFVLSSKVEPMWGIRNMQNCWFNIWWFDENKITVSD